MRLDDFTYQLPQEVIADRPPEVRGTSRLLVLDRKKGGYSDDFYKNISVYLQPGDVLVLNNTKVIKARLMAKTESGADRELLLLQRHGAAYDPHSMHVMYRRKLKEGQTLHLDSAAVTVKKLHGDGTATITSEADLLAIAAQYGSVPLPPYMHRQADEEDIKRYQTVFANEPGSVAAPTASLNLTDEILQGIRAKGIIIAEITLHVGLGTFMPIRTDNLMEHKMHSEFFMVPASTVTSIRKAKSSGKRIVAVGTTVTRTLEYAADTILGDKPAALLEGEADIFIYPGYVFRVIDAMVTNFHAPKSTVLMMAAAFAGWFNLKTAYDYAIANGYKLLSYGDSMLII